MLRRRFLDCLAFGTAAAALAGCATDASPSAPAGPDPEPDPDPAPPINEAAQPLRIAMVIYPKFTAQDMIGPHTVLSQLSNTQVHIVAKTLATVTSDMGLKLTPSHTFATCPSTVDVLFVPGGTFGTIDAMQDPELLAFLQSRGATATWVTSVCTGSLVLGTAGLLRGYRATSHWVARDILATLEATPVAERIVEDRNRLTGAGVSAGLDFGIYLAGKLRSVAEAQTIQLNIEYDPEPPYPGGGNPATAEPAIVAGLEARYVPFLEQANAAADAAAAQFP